MTQLWPEGVPIEVEAVDGLPRAFRWQRRHSVHAIVEQWMVRDEWWREEIWRHYFQVETDAALLCVLYHDLLTGDWRLERVYD
ncbi:MAG TPA: hypothetical protein PKM78_16255 [Anaerolineae bacterium]|nr:hypothetical protein [Anaerolineae bacterium]